jgi:hypothetical protein
LRRNGDRLHITIHGVRDGFTRPNWQTQHGELRFSATCDLWKFAAKAQLAVGRLEPAGEQYHDSTGVQQSPEYRALCTFIEGHKSVHRPLSSTSKRRQKRH